jgi:hypothetical protein
VRQRSVRGIEYPVAQKIQTLFIDDLDGSAAEGTVRFGLDGTEYEIDLNEKQPRPCGTRLRAMSAQPGEPTVPAGQREPDAGLRRTG